MATLLVFLICLGVTLLANDLGLEGNELTIFGIISGTVFGLLSLYVPSVWAALLVIFVPLATTGVVSFMQGMKRP